MRLGGAANVAHNIVGARRPAVARRHCRHRRCGDRSCGSSCVRPASTPDGLVEDRRRPTTEKVRIVTDRNQQVARIDYEGDTDAGGAVEARDRRAHRSARRAARRRCSYPTISKGAVTRAVVEALVAVSARRGPRPRTRRAPDRRSEDPAPGPLRRRDARHAEPSRGGGRDASADPDGRGRARGGARFQGDAPRCEAVLITRGEQGMWLSDSAIGGIDPGGRAGSRRRHRRRRHRRRDAGAGAGRRRDAGRGRRPRQSRRRHRRRQVRPGDGHRQRARRFILMLILNVISAFTSRTRTSLTDRNHDVSAWAKSREAEHDDAEREQQ